MQKIIVKKVKVGDSKAFSETLEEMEQKGYVLAFAHKDTLVFEYVGKEKIEKMIEEMNFIW